MAAVYVLLYREHQLLNARAHIECKAMQQSES